MGKKAKAIQEYADGWLAITHEGNPYTAKLGERPLRVTDFDHMDLWDGLLEIHNRSISWKERHAKGVPVKMTFKEWANCVDFTPIYDGVDRHFNHGDPKAMCGSFKSFYFATFCNFRYKPEWLEKKGVANE